VGRLRPDAPDAEEDREYRSCQDAPEPSGEAAEEREYHKDLSIEGAEKKEGWRPSVPAVLEPADGEPQRGVP
jgi:hypothetical protein